jgi:hypothetical protein
MLKVATSILGRDRTQRIVGGFEFTKVIEERETTPHVAGVLYFAAFVGISSGFQQDGADLTSVVLVFTAVVVLGSGHGSRCCL